MFSFVFNNSTTAGTSAQLIIDDISFTFTKQEMVNISINYTRAFKNTDGNYDIAPYIPPVAIPPLVQQVSRFPPVIFTFKITGIPREVVAKNQELLNLK